MRGVEVGAEYFGIGNRTLRQARRALAARGTAVKTVPKARDLFDIALTCCSSRRARLVVVRPRRRDLELLSRWMEEGKVASVVQATYPLDRVGEAEAHVATRHTRGKVVIAVA